MKVSYADEEDAATSTTHFGTVINCDLEKMLVCVQWPGEEGENDWVSLLEVRAPAYARPHGFAVRPATVPAASVSLSPSVPT